MDAIHAGEIKGMYIMGENPAMSDPDVQHAREALAKLEHLVVQDIFLTETAWHADVVLPASAFPEKNGTFTNTDRHVQIGRAALPLPGEARQDWGSSRSSPAASGSTGPTSDPRDVFAEMAGDAVARRTSPGSGWSARARSPIPCDARGRARQRDRLRRRLPDRERPRQARAGRDACRPTRCPTTSIRWS